MNSELVNPNLHVVLVHIPLGLLFVGVAIEFFSFLGWRRSAFRTAGRWMIFIGALSTVPTALSGAYALNQVARDSVDPIVAGGNWNDVLAATPLIHAHNGAAWEHLKDHTLQQALATGILLLAVLVWLSCSDHFRAKLHLPIFALILLGAGAAAWGSWNAGEAVYSHGVSVRLEDTPSTLPTSRASDEATHSHVLQKRIGFYFPPMQLHVIFAGLTISMAVVALGLGIRNATTVGKPVRDMDDLATALGNTAAADPYISSEHSQNLRDLNELEHHHAPPSARFWMLVVLIGSMTAVLGIYMLAGPHGANTRIVQTLVDQVRNPDQNPAGPVSRRMAHVIAGSSIIVLALLLAFFGRFAPRRRFFVLFLGLILLIVAAAQVWFGILLLFDTNVGSLRGIN